MSTQSVEFKCRDCGQVIHTTEPRKNCPNCGSERITAVVSLNETVNISDTFKVKKIK